jgi:AbiV family abortive infection protein
MGGEPGVKPRAIRDLFQLNDAELLSELSVGLRLCVGNAQRLWRDARKLRVARRPQGFEILRLFVEEEAAKFHILLDAVRCPRKPADRFAKQLGYFNQHLAKGLYAKYYNFASPSDLTEIRSYMDRERQTLYLDGLNDVDWVFRNDILRNREESIYVDYVAYADSFRDEHHWHSPDPRLMGLWLLRSRPRVLDVALAIHGAGMTTEAALAKVADLWRASPMDDTIKWSALRQLNVRTLNILEESKLLRVRPHSVYRRVANEWLFPLYPLDLGELKIDPEELREVQRNWSPDGY